MELEDLEDKWMNLNYVNEKVYTEEDYAEQARKYANPFKFRDINKKLRK